MYFLFKLSFTLCTSCTNYYDDDDDDKYDDEDEDDDGVLNPFCPE